MTESRAILRMAIDTPLRRLFDYLSPAVVPAQLQPGMRLWLPFGRRRVLGVLVEMATDSDVPHHKLRRAYEVLDQEPVFDAALMGLLKFAAEYYRHPIGEVFAAALPGALGQGALLRDQHSAWRLRADADPKSVPARATRLYALLDALADGQWRDAASLQSTHSDWRAALRDLQQKQLVETAEFAAPAVGRDSSRLEPVGLKPDLPVLGPAQQSALTHIIASLGEFKTLLLHGVTGSGKTEVYLRAIAEVLQRGEQALVLAPEIALTPQLLARFAQRFGEPIAVLHSALNDSERVQAWRAARDGNARIMIGTRSAIFTALAKPGLIIVDEEHDASYKQQEGFRYSARDLAIARAQRHGIPVLLGSATPSLETLQRALQAPGDLLKLPERAGAALPPIMKLVDLRQHGSTQGLSTPVMQRIREHLDAQGQVLLYLNRRGFAPVLFCPSCGWSAPCARCDARLTVHKRAHKLICHHCGHEQPLTQECPSCHAEVKPVGQGTERIEDTLAQIYPDAPLARIDRDSISRKGELDAVLKRIHDGEVKLLVGTQMLSKGHHFPNVTLVVILDADQGLFSTDFRGSERLAQNILQVAGRAGRGDRPGEVMIQTEYPDHPLLQKLLAEGYDGFAAAALTERQAAHWPPFSRLALIRAEANDLGKALTFLQTAKQLGRALHQPKVTLLGPAPAPMMRRAGLHRAQLLLTAATPAPLQNLLARLLPQLETHAVAKAVRWSVDVDPLELF
jgi:primosomal protein N' (replication factor Y) (superfamily II helicase)